MHARGNGRETSEMKRLLAIIALAIFASIVAPQTSAQAQNWPLRQITLIVPFPPGGSTDVVARIMAEGMRPLLGQPIVIENVGGAGGSIGVGRVARAAPDGYTIDIGQWDTHVGGVIYSLNYDLQKDFEPVGLLSINPQLMVGRKDLPADDLTSLVVWMKANPGKATLINQLASAQLAGQLLQQLTGTKLQFIPYRGAGPAMTDLLAGQVDLMVSQAAVLLPNIQAKTVKPLANLSPARSAAVPDIATADESGLPGLYASGWFGLFAPKGTPKDIVGKLNAAMVRVLAEPTIRPRFTQLGLDIASPEFQSPEGLGAFHKAEVEKWWPILKSANIRAE
jgi:tripartite-type tricarboxylate transporter receptor subunit TctC